jgi:hypothetical protein
MEGHSLSQEDVMLNSDAICNNTFQEMSFK